MNLILTTAALLFGFFGPASFVRAVEATLTAWRKARLDERGWATAGEWGALFWACLQGLFWGVAVVGVGAFLFFHMHRLDYAPGASVLFNAWLIGLAVFVWVLAARSTVAMGVLGAVVRPDARHRLRLVLRGAAGLVGLGRSQSCLA